MDEVGRGPLAGPVTVCGVLWITEEAPENFFPNIRDSKKLSEKQRNAFLKKIYALNNTKLVTQVASVSAAVIDEIGISKALYRASEEVLCKLSEKYTIQHILADYGLPLSKKYPSDSIIKGDEKEALIALASIVAKVTRDREMIAYAQPFPQYGFERNKGYGTKEHRGAIKQYGVTALHRKSFLKNLQME